MAVCRDSSSISSLVIKVYFFVYQKYFAKLNIALNSLSMLIVSSVFAKSGRLPSISISKIIIIKLMGHADVPLLHSFFLLQ